MITRPKNPNAETLEVEQNPDIQKSLQAGFRVVSINNTVKR